MGHFFVFSSVCHVDERIETFLNHFTTTLANMSDEEMSTLRETLISMKQTVDITLGEEVARNWGEIVDGEYVFDRRKRQVKHLVCMSFVSSSCTVIYSIQ